MEDSKTILGMFNQKNSSQFIIFKFMEKKLMSR